MLRSVPPTDHQEAPDALPTLPHRGSRIAYLHRTVPAEGPWPPARVYTIEPDGSSNRLLMEMPQARQPEGFSWQPLR
jgi:hypothetical protein